MVILSTQWLKQDQGQMGGHSGKAYNLQHINEIDDDESVASAN
jgi:hypothetical protein